MRVFFENLPHKFKFLENLTRRTGTLHEGLWAFTIPRSILFTMRNALNKNYRENQTNLTFIYIPFFFFPRKFELFYDKVEKYGMSQTTI